MYQGSLQAVWRSSVATAPNGSRQRRGRGGGQCSTYSGGQHGRAAQPVALTSNPMGKLLLLGVWAGVVQLRLVSNACKYASMVVQLWP
jgi:hypothetical protein